MLLTLRLYSASPLNSTVLSSSSSSSFLVHAGRRPRIVVRCSVHRHLEVRKHFLLHHVVVHEELGRRGVARTVIPAMTYVDSRYKDLFTFIEEGERQRVHVYI